MRRLGVVTALNCEQRPLTGVSARPGQIRALPNGGLVGVSGPGPDAATALATRLLKAGADSLLSWGLAGALVDHLGPGALIVPGCLAGSDGSRYQVRDSDWRTSLDSLGLIHPLGRETMAESRVVLRSRAQKQVLRARTGAIAVDMESAAVARAASAAGVPFLSLRVIADSLRHDIPAWIPEQLASRDRWNTAGLVARALGSPRDWRELLRLALALRQALQRLREVAPLVR